MARTALDDRDKELLQATNFCFVSTVREDGTPHCVPVWVDTDGENVVLNTAEGRAWPTNARRTQTVTCTVANAENPYEYLTVTGAIAQDTHEGAFEHIDAMAKKYMGKDKYPFHQPGDERVILKVAPDRVHRHGS